MSFFEQLEVVWSYRSGLLQSLWVSLLISLCAVVIGFVIGVILAGIKIAPKYNIIIKILDKIADLYITVIRGTPMLVQLILMYGVILVSFKDVFGIFS